MSFLELLKKIPIDFAQGTMRDKTKGKQIAMSLVGQGFDKHALDVGCRDGHQTQWLHYHGYDVKSIDIVKKFPMALIVDVNKPLQYEDGSLDLVWCSEVIEHLEDPGFTISEFRRILKSGGDLLITTPNSAFWFYHVMKLFGKSPKDLQRDDHLHFFKKEDIDYMFPKADIYGFFPYAFLKFKIKKFIGLLSPTFVVHEVKK